jgi:hypothetical protein
MRARHNQTPSPRHGNARASLGPIALTLATIGLASQFAVAQLTPPVPAAPPAKPVSPSQSPEGPAPDAVPGRNEPGEPIAPDAPEPTVTPDRRGPGEPAPGTRPA